MFLLKIKQKEEKETIFEKGYKGLLNWVLNKRAITIICSLAIFIGSLTLIPKIPQNFLPQDKSVSCRLNADLPDGTSIEKSNKVALELEEVLKKEKLIKHVQTVVDGEHIRISIDLKNNITKDQTKAFEKNVKDQAIKVEDQMLVALSPVGIVGTSNLVLIVEGGSPKELEAAGQLITNKIKNIPGLENVITNKTGVKQQLQLNINDERAAKNGLNPMVIANSIREMIAGENVAQIQIDGTTTAVHLLLKNNPFNDLSDITGQKLTNAVGDQVKLSDVATLSKTHSPSALYRLNKQEYVEVSGRITTDNASGVQAEVEKRLKSIQFPTGVKYRSEGQAKAMNVGFTNIILSIIVAVVLVFIVMLIAFGNMRSCRLPYYHPYLFYLQEDCWASLQRSKHLECLHLLGF